MPNFFKKRFEAQSFNHFTMQKFERSGNIYVKHMGGYLNLNRWTGHVSIVVNQEDHMVLGTPCKSEDEARALIEMYKDQQLKMME
ncbi:MAG: hypothetical protein ABIN25_06830 [Ginsengibacter sp.]